ncbi:MULTISPECIES: 4'-phosphopantetheinyl transferase family protein [unclassified Gilliamella]|uniref:4'-phosphopantetheinyl transferase family protein n=1 Tax=unclassified Gilliamella TaxID=2685620 RepID=UPI003A5CE25F
MVCITRSKKKILSYSAQLEIDKFKFDQDKCRSLVGKMLLLYALQRHEQFQQSRLPVIDYGLYRKPYIRTIKGHFNISHAHDWVACVYSCNGEVGIDIEHITPINILDYHDVMTENEYQRALNDPQFDFFQLWTLKEAIMKAQGQGFYLPPSSFELPSPFHNDDIIEINHTHWFLYSQSFTNEYKLSLASLYPTDGQVQVIPLQPDQFWQ